jgi:hypothetical protein
MVLLTKHHLLSKTRQVRTKNNVQLGKLYMNTLITAQMTQLNLCTLDLTNIECLSKYCPNVELLSLSVNRLNGVQLGKGLSLLHSSLKELYVRDNLIGSTLPSQPLNEDEFHEAVLDELDWLCGMERLEVVWLEGNPLCQRVPK